MIMVTEDQIREAVRPWVHLVQLETMIIEQLKLASRANKIKLHFIPQGQDDLDQTETIN